MKTSFKSAALVLGLAFLSTGVFAATKTTEAPETTTQNIVLFTSLPSNLGVQVIVHKATPSESIVKIYDAENNVIYNDILTKKDAVSRKGYQLGELATGDYTFEVTANKTVTKRIVHIYENENHQKDFFFEI